MKRFFIICIMVCMLFSYASYAKSANRNKKTDEQTSGSNFYDSMLHRIETAREEKPINLPLQERITVTCVDIVVSLLCLWLAVLIITNLNIWDIKKYGWIFISFNVIWFIFLLFFRFGWEIIDFIALKLEPGLLDTILNNFTLILIISAIAIYIWILARTFSLNFLGALKLCLVSHLIYFLFIFLFSIASSHLENPVSALLRNNLGVNSVFHGYVSDMHKIAHRQEWLSLLRVRVFHL